MSALTDAINRHVGRSLVTATDVPDADTDQIVLRFHQAGSRIDRYLALTWTVNGIVASEVREGSEMLTRIADARYKSNHLSAAIRPVAALNADEIRVLVGEFDGGAA